MCLVYAVAQMLAGFVAGGLAWYVIFDSTMSLLSAFCVMASRGADHSVRPSERLGVSQTLTRTRIANRE